MSISKEKVDPELAAGLEEWNTGPYKDRSHKRLEGYMESATEMNRKEFCNLVMNVLYNRCLTNRKQTELTKATLKCIQRLGLRNKFQKEFTRATHVWDECAAADFLDELDDGKTARGWWG